MKCFMTITRIITILPVLGVFLVIVGCTSNYPESKDMNITTLETVLKNTFTAGPDDELTKLLTKRENATIIGEDPEIKQPQKPTELDLFLEEMYRTHFTEYMFHEYLTIYATSFQPLGGERIKVESINIEQLEDYENRYDFITIVELQNKGKVFEIKGEAKFTEGGKISLFQLLTDSGLSDTLQLR
ncbi:hypothetical protein ACFO3D_01945 [Virgibacillus kekensis]|uniref:Lipoprotein n=1 Tax=Virgibacillus kekensis TaxID=202261 RepID=A0ABV9DGM0_9BACI